MLALNASSAQATRPDSGQSRALLTTLAALPVVGPLIQSAMSWWESHPLHAIAELFTPRPASATEPLAQPLTQRHPWAMLLGAVAVGALLMWTRPWRFALLRRAVYSALLPQLVTTLSHVSTDGLLDLVKLMLRRPAANTSPPPAAEQPAGEDVTTPNSTLH